MTIVLCDISALEVYRANRYRRFPRPLKKRAAEKVFTESSEFVTTGEARAFDLSRYGVVENAEPLHLLVPSDKCKRSIRGVRFHVRSDITLPSTLIELERDVYIVSPEMLFMQMAVTRSIPLLAEMGMELCGRYEVEAYASHRDDRPEALTTPPRLGRFLQTHGGEYGARKAMEALSHVVGNSWSPMETKVCLILCLPRTMGGYGLPKPEMNGEIKLPPHIVLADGRRTLYCDLYWRGRYFAVEYDGEESHAGKAGLVRDDRKKAVLTSLGIDCICLTSYDVYYADAMDLAARRIADKLGVQHRRPSRNMLKKRIALRKALLLGQ